MNKPTNPPTERLIAFEFVAAEDGPQLVTLKRKGVVVLQFAFVTWLGVDLQPFASMLAFESREDLDIEGHGLGHPYWNNEMPTWLTSSFDPIAEARRIVAIRDAASREARRTTLALM